MDIHSKIYVAGHTGLVGSAILRALKKCGYLNVVTKNIEELDLRNQSKVEDFFNQQQPNYVFLAAATVGGIWANNQHKANFIYDNILIAANIINSAYKFNVKKLINLGSSCIYPKHAPQPLKEEYLLTGPLEPTNEAYAVAKIAAIKLCRYFNEQYNTNFISVMPTNLYGPNDNFNLETAHVLPAIMRKIHLAKCLSSKNFTAIRSDMEKYKLSNSINNFNNLSNSEIETLLLKFGISPEQVTLWGTGQVYREFLFVDDLAQALIFLMNKCDFKDLGECINIGVGQDLKICELANLIKKTINFTGNINFDCTSLEGTPRKLLDISKISNLGWTAKSSLEQGISNTYSWYSTIAPTHHYTTCATC